MKLSLGLVALALQFAGVMSTSARTAEEHAALVEKCGDLGVMDVPEGKDPADYRDCASHPIGRAPQSDARALKGGEIFRRAALGCARNASGCERGWCWKKCNESTGAWCWTGMFSPGNDREDPSYLCTRLLTCAAKGDKGQGDWLTCSENAQCSTRAKCGINCKKASDCKCSC